MLNVTRTSAETVLNSLSPARMAICDVVMALKMVSIAKLRIVDSRCGASTNIAICLAKITWMSESIRLKISVIPTMPGIFPEHLHIFLFSGSLH